MANKRQSYCQGLPALIKMRQLRKVEHCVIRQRLQKYFQSPDLQFGNSLVKWFLKNYVDKLGQVLLHHPFGLCLKTKQGIYHTLVPKMRRRKTDWAMVRIGDRQFYIGKLFGSCHVLVTLSTQRVVFYIPPKELSECEILKIDLLLTGFHMYIIERSLPNWVGHVASMAPILLAAMTSLCPQIDIASNKKVSFVFEKMRQAVLQENEMFDAGAELLGQSHTSFITSFLAAINQFII